MKAQRGDAVFLSFFLATNAKQYLQRPEARPSMNSQHSNVKTPADTASRHRQRQHASHKATDTLQTPSRSSVLSLCSAKVDRPRPHHLAPHLSSPPLPTYQDPPHPVQPQSAFENATNEQRERENCTSESPHPFVSNYIHHHHQHLPNNYLAPPRYQYFLLRAQT